MALAAGQRLHSLGELPGVGPARVELARALLLFFAEYGRIIISVLASTGETDAVFIERNLLVKFRFRRNHIVRPLCGATQGNCWARLEELSWL